MSKQVLGSSLHRLGALAALFGLVVGCHAVEMGSSGQLEVFARHSDGAPCVVIVPGHLELAAVVDAERVRISGEELCRGGIVRRELPAGLYSVTWQPNLPADGGEKDGASGAAEPRIVDEDEARWTLRGPNVVSVLPGRVTRIRVHRAAPDRELASNAP